MKVINSTINNTKRDLNENQNLIISYMRIASKKIAPLWSLENFVAVNPYLGHIDKPFKRVALDLSFSGGIDSTLPVDFYLKKWDEKIICSNDLKSALKRHNLIESPESFIKQIKRNKTLNHKTTATITDVAKQITNKDWNRFMQERISNWAASFFDNGQAAWNAFKDENKLFDSWKNEASIDFSPEIIGLKSFRKHVKSLPENPIDAVEQVLKEIDLPKEVVPLYLHRLLLKSGGWSAYAARIDWESELYGGKDGALIEFLSVLVCWEFCLFKSLNNSKLKSEWQNAIQLFISINEKELINKDLLNVLILQEAFEISAQRKLIQSFNSNIQSTSKNKENKNVQAIFCIDVRSELFRRNLETIDKNIETIGFAGFFGFPVNFKPIGQETGESQCPVLLPTSHNVLEKINAEDQEAIVEYRQTKTQIRKVWKTFKSGAITCFSFVSPIGLYYLPKLITDSFGLTRPVVKPNDVGFTKKSIKNKSVNIDHTISENSSIGIPLEDQIKMAKGALTAMSLKEGFAEIILIVGHGSNMVNNPHASGYDCGACGGHTGEVNAKVASEVLNNSKVREALKNENIIIPDTTIFLACLHDTTTDEITVFDEEKVPKESINSFLELKKSLSDAGVAARAERARRFKSENVNVDRYIFQKTKDWSQVRPEWGLAGCSTFVIAPRERTKNIDFGGKSFLHSYNWEKDTDFSVLETIMTAPMIVTSWINLQYYGSTVDNKNYGSGNKTLHNVTSGIGVLEGYSGDLRVGLPFQAIHDGENYQHEPLKLNVIIEAPIEEINKVIKKHKMVRDLCDNGWIHLSVLNSEGKISQTYHSNLEWKNIPSFMEN